METELYLGARNLDNQFTPTELLPSTLYKYRLSKLIVHLTSVSLYSHLIKPGICRSRRKVGASQLRTCFGRTGSSIEVIQPFFLFLEAECTEHVRLGFRGSGLYHYRVHH
jgi:hypothetical protein